MFGDSKGLSSEWQMPPLPLRKLRKLRKASRAAGSSEAAPPRLPPQLGGRFGTPKGSSSPSAWALWLWMAPITATKEVEWNPKKGPHVFAQLHSKALCGSVWGPRLRHLRSEEGLGRCGCPGQYELSRLRLCHWPRLHFSKPWACMMCVYACL